MSISPEGRWLVLIFLAGSALGYAACGVVCAVPPWLAALFFGYLFRDPERVIPAAPLGVVSPVDGRVLAVDEVTDPYLNRLSVRIRLAMPALGPFTTRGPIEGKILQQWYLPQGLLTAEARLAAPREALARHPDAGQARVAMWIRTDEEDDVIFAVHGANIARRLSCSVHPGERIGQGQRCGYIRLRAQAVVHVPADSRIQVKAGDTVRAGSDIIAALVHRAGLRE